MSTLPHMDTPDIYWIDNSSQQQGPETLATVLDRIAHQQIPLSTPVWWPGCAQWGPFDANPELIQALTVRHPPAPAAEPVAPQPVFTQPVFAPPAAQTVVAEPAFAAPSAEPVFAAPVFAEVASAAPAPPAPTMPAPPMPVVTMPEVVEPAPAPAPTPSLQLGDTAELERTFAELTVRSEAFAAEQGKIERLDDAIATALGRALTSLGFTVDSTTQSEERHLISLTAPDGSSSSLMVDRVEHAATLASTLEWPLNCSISHGGTAAVELFLGDYVDADGQINDGLLRHHIASVVNAASR